MNELGEKIKNNRERLDSFYDRHTQLLDRLEKLTERMHDCLNKSSGRHTGTLGK